VSGASNPYLPRPAIIDAITIENDARDLKTFRLVLEDREVVGDFTFECGQFAMLSAAGAGESPLGIASSPEDAEFVEFTMKLYPTGVVTNALHRMEEGDRVGLRGPYGNSFPLDELEGKNFLIIGGGFAFTTLRSTVRYMLNDNNRHRFGNIAVLYGARSPGELLYKSELDQWVDRDDLRLYVTVDKGDENWKGRVGFVPTVLKEVSPSSANAVVLLCGPPIMLKFTIMNLVELGFTHERIYTSLERRMSCGVGKCGRCNVGSKYVCKDGPIFTFDKILELAEGLT
jgi:sulfhydrogenase subunit gamma (sulfur reductase)